MHLLDATGAELAAAVGDKTQVAHAILDALPSRPAPSALVPWTP